MVQVKKVRAPRDRYHVGVLEEIRKASGQDYLLLFTQAKSIATKVK